jgi:hypothetical protein
MKTFKTYLIEKYLLGEFQIGFELEAILEAKLKQTDKAVQGEYSYFYHYGRNENYIPSKKMDNFISFTNKSIGNSEFTYDGTILADNDGDIAFEMKSPVFEYNPKNILSIKNYLKSLPSKKVYTNASCGFHVHISFPRLNSEDMIWLFFNMVLDKTFTDNYINKFITNDDIEISFISDEMASASWQEKYRKLLTTAITSDNFNNLYKAMKSESKEKWYNIRLHPQGTIEFRGPREFMDNYDISNIDSFFNHITTIIKWFSNVLSKNEMKVGNEIISKKDFFNKLYLNKPALNKISKTDSNKHFSQEQDKTIIPEIKKIAPWLFNSGVKFKNALIYINKRYNTIEWADGEWSSGTFKGLWIDGNWVNGEWQGSLYNIANGKIIKTNTPPE